MKPFLDENFLLHNPTAIRLYHEYAVSMPIIDYHCHLPPAQIAEDKIFRNITEAWLYGDHYKWRAMRTNGVNEEYITGHASDEQKFLQWGATVPYTLRNPLYHWTHLELQRYFDVHTLLNEQSAAAIYHEVNEKLTTPAYSVKNLLRKMNVNLVCTTDDPTDDLQYHTQLLNDGFDIPVRPAFRPDAAMAVQDTSSFNLYLEKLEKSADQNINTFQDYLDALKKRHNYFAGHGCHLSDHGLDRIYAEEYSDASLKSIFNAIRSGDALSQQDVRAFQSAMLVIFAEWDHEKGWVQQFHLGALRNNNSRMMRSLGPDTGWDSIGDESQGRALARFLDKLDARNKLTKTILYNLNPADNELMATMAGNFNDGSVPGKIQWGSAWWFLDQKDGMTKQLNALSNMGLISRLVGMLTDSRSFLSFPRHEYFRRLLCNLFGEEIEKGELPDDIGWTGKIVQDICYHNARQYFELG